MSVVCLLLVAWCLVFCSVLVSLQMAVVNDLSVLGLACRRKFMSILDRLFKLVHTGKSAGAKHLQLCLKTMCRFMVGASVSQVASLVAPTQRAVHNSSSNNNNNNSSGGLRSPTLMRELAKVSTTPVVHPLDTSDTSHVLTLPSLLYY